eukprot:364272-Chlamydomonas_euryale.AAC.1
MDGIHHNPQALCCPCVAPRARRTGMQADATQHQQPVHEKRHSQQTAIDAPPPCMVHRRTAATLARTAP